MFNRLHIARFLLIVLSPMPILGCGAGMSDIDIPLVNGYVFSDKGGWQKSIFYPGLNPISDVYIGETVLTFDIQGDYVAALRQPITTYIEANITMTRAEEKCEYWLLDSKHHKLMGPYDKVRFIQFSAKYGFTSEALTEPISDKVSKFCFDS